MYTKFKREWEKKAMLKEKQEKKWDKKKRQDNGTEEIKCRCRGKSSGPGEKDDAKVMKVYGLERDKVEEETMDYWARINRKYNNDT